MLVESFIKRWRSKEPNVVVAVVDAVVVVVVDAVVVVVGVRKMFLNG